MRFNINKHHICAMVIGLGLCVALLVIAAIVVSSTSTSPSQSTPAGTISTSFNSQPPTASSMTVADCQALTQGEPESQVRATYGNSQSSGNGGPEIEVQYSYDVNFYNTTINTECDVYYDSHKRVRMVFLELLPNG